MKNKSASSSRTMIILIFLLLYYVYSLRTIMIPLESITIPILFLLTMVIVIKRNYGRNKSIMPDVRTLTSTWIVIAIYIFIDNANLLDQLVHGGMIQLYVLICFLCYVRRDENWFQTWLKWTKIFTIVYAIATIVFYFNSGLYYQFVLRIYPDLATELIKFYEKGWMCGICDHFSTNGMVLATGLMICVNEILTKGVHRNKGWRNNKILMLTTIFLLYALILSSKRAPLIASILAISFTYIVSSSKGMNKKIISLSILGALLFFTYEFLLPHIPGLSTIADKFQSTSESDGGVLQGRMDLWTVAFNMIETAPIFGHGFGSYSYLTEDMDMFTTSTHNYYLQAFAELGIIGVFLYITAFFLAIRLTIKTLRWMVKHSAIVTSIDRLVICVSLSIQIFVVLYNLSSSAMIYYNITFPYFISVTAACILTKKYRYGYRKSFVYS